MDRAFILATEFPRYSCLGVELQPLTIGHVFLLQRIGNQLATGGAWTVEDIGVATAICSQPWDESERDIRRWWFPWYVGRLGARLAKLDLKDQVSSFFSYWRDSHARPFIKTRSDEVYEPMGTSLHWVLLAVLRSRFHMTEREALSYPIVRGLALKTALDEEAGKIRLTNSDDEELLAAAERHRAEHAAANSGGER